MLRQVIYALEKQNVRGIRRLQARLKKEGVFCASLEQWERDMRYCSLEGKKPNKEKLKQHLLLITDSPELLREASQKGVAAIGFCPSTEDYFPGAAYVLQSFEGIDAAFLEEYLLRFLGKPVEAVRTRRLVLRETRMEDFPALYRISLQPGMRYGMEEKPGSREEERQKLEAYIKTAYRLYGFGLWTVLCEEKVIGRCGITPFRLEDGSFALELGYMLDENRQHQGYGTEMCRGVIRYARERLETEELWCRIHPDNHSSIRLARRLGFVRLYQGPDGLFYYKRINA